MGLTRTLYNPYESQRGWRGDYLAPTVDSVNGEYPLQEPSETSSWDNHLSAFKLKNLPHKQYPHYEIHPWGGKQREFSIHPSSNPDEETFKRPVKERSWMGIISRSAWNNSPSCEGKQRAESALDTELSRERAWMSGVLSVSFL